jgi:DNA-binding HxlR family transcriptional regulator
VLTNQLNELVTYGFVYKTIYDTKVPNVEYKLTALGQSLLPVFLTLESFVENNRTVLEKPL